jgi:hypothetical protein
MAKSRSYNQKTLGLLWGNSGNVCAFPGCNQLLTKDKTEKDNPIVIGEIAHIVAFGKNSPVSPRNEDGYPEDQLNEYENLILLCPSHHTIVDKQANTHTAEDLRNWKKFRESEHARLIVEGYQNVSFIELEQILKAVPLVEQSTNAPDFQLIKISEKVKKNDLSQSSEKLLKLGYQSLNDVENYIQGCASFDTSYPERLKSGFIVLYNEIYKMSLRGDSLLLSLKERIVSNRTDTLLHSAALAVILYYFEKCEIFEK